MQHSALIHRQGFSLVQIAVLVAVAGIILASMLPGGDLGSDVAKERVTRERMDKIEEAMQAFMAKNLRRPCPADGGALMEDNDFGMERDDPGTCSNADFNEIAGGGTSITATTTSGSAIVTISSGDSRYFEPGMLVTASAGIADDTHVLSLDSNTQLSLSKNATATGSRTLNFYSVVAGVVPTKTLGLPDEYMFDGYGRRINYMVDLRATNATTCRDMQTGGASGNVRIFNTSSDSSPADRVMWALISYGKDGYGAYSMSGSTTRSNTGSTDTDQNINAFVDDSTNFASTFTADRGLVRKAKTATFDDTVWTLETTKNTCAIGRMANYGTRIDGAASEGLGTSVVTGDVNGDGIKDIITSTPGGTYPTTYPIRIIFGRKNGWPTQAGVDASALGIARGVTVTNGNNYDNFARYVATTDIDNDGKSDLLIASGSATGYVTIIFGADLTQDRATNYASNKLVTLPAFSLSTSGQLSVGNFNGDDYNDFLVRTSSSTVYLLYGSAAFTDVTAESSSLDSAPGGRGFKIVTSDSTNKKLSVLLETGNLNNDAYDDIIIHHGGGDVDKAMLVLGRSNSNWNTAMYSQVSGSTPDTLRFDEQAYTSTSGLAFAVGGQGSSTNVLDFGGDAAKDLLVNNNSYMSVFYGQSAGNFSTWTAPVNLTSDATTYNGTNGFRFQVTTSKPSWIQANPLKIAVAGDVNQDGKNDIIMVDSTADPVYSGSTITNAGTNLVILQPTGGWSAYDGEFTLFSTVFTSSALPQSNDTTKGFRIDGSTASDAAVVKAIADINNDGINDIIIGAPGRNSGSGSIYILFGRKNVPWNPLEYLGDLD